MRLLTDRIYRSASQSAQFASSDYPLAYFWQMAVKYVRGINKVFFRAIHLILDVTQTCISNPKVVCRISHGRSQEEVPTFVVCFREISELMGQWT